MPLKYLKHMLNTLARLLGSKQTNEGDALSARLYQKRLKDVKVVGAKGLTPALFLAAQGKGK